MSEREKMWKQVEHTIMHDCVDAVQNGLPSDFEPTVGRIKKLIKAAGYIIVPKKATRKMTIVAESMGMGEAYAEDVYAAMTQESGDE